jgi:deazaflavin-dependent oxidoreductase (nitroreductase family)
VWPFVVTSHIALYKATGGLLGRRIPFIGRMLLLDHIGAKSGTKRTTPLLYLEDDRNLVIIASKGGHSRNPAWFHNLRANPDTTVQVGSERRDVRARVAGPEERARLWPRAVDTYSGYADYQRRTDREIPLVILAPRYEAE